MTERPLSSNPSLQIPHDPEAVGVIANVAIVAKPGGRASFGLLVKARRGCAGGSRRWSRRMRHWGFQQSSTHSAAFPEVSNKPKPLGRNDATAEVCRVAGLPQPSHCACAALTCGGNELRPRVASSQIREAMPSCFYREGSGRPAGLGANRIAPRASRSITPADESQSGYASRKMVPSQLNAGGEFEHYSVRS
jgi:hypothetical protein